MKSKFLLFALLSLVGGGFLIVGNQEEVVADYSPRASQKTEASAAGMHEIYTKLRGNLETGKIEPQDRIEMQKAVERHQEATKGNRELDLSWIEMGPDNVGGRTRALLAVDNNTIFAGSVSGGLWKSTNGANTWKKVASFPSCCIGSIAQAGDGTIYVGTGNDFDGSPGGDGASNFVGAGLFKSEDGGVSWTVIEGTVPTFMAANSNWNAINSLERDGAHPSRIWIGADAGFGYYDNANDELVMNDQDGMIQNAVQDITSSADGSFILVASGPARIFRSTNSGESFEEISGGGGDLPSSNGRGRVAISQSDENSCFILYAQNGGSMGGVYHSADGGDSWTSTWLSGIPEIDPTGDNNQGYYDLALGIHPGNPELAFVGAVTHWKNGPSTSPELAAFNFGSGEEQLYVHSDILEYIWAPNGDMYIGTDGGVFKSTNGGLTYFPANRGYNVTQYYGIAHGSRPIGATSLGNEAGTEASVMGGSQDNGTHVIFGPGAWESDQEGLEVMGGDGFDCDMSQVTAGNVTVVFATSQYGIVSRFDSNGSGGQFYDDELFDVYEAADFEPGGFYSVVRLFEDTEDEDSQQFITLVNPADTSIYDADPDDGEPVTITLLTNNLDVPFTWELPALDTLHFWDEIIRPEVTLDDSMTVDPNYPWLGTQDLIEKIINCDTDSMAVDTVDVIADIIEETMTIYWTDTLTVDGEQIIINDSTVVVIGTDTLFVEQIVYAYESVCDTLWHYAADSFENVAEQRQIPDNYTSLFALGLQGGNGLWITRQALNMNTTPDWFKVIPTVAGAVKAMEFSPDGNHLFYSTWGSSLYRISGLDQLWSEEDVDNLEITQIIGNAGGTVTGIAFDPAWSEDNQHVVVTVGGYGNVNAGHVQETFNALGETVSWDNIWFPSSNDLSKMPVFDAIIDVNDPTGQTIVVGTEFGVFTTDNGGGTNGGDWVQKNAPTDSEQSTGIDDCPVFSIKQQSAGAVDGSVKWRVPQNFGAIYAGSHGRGIFRSDEGVTTTVQEKDPAVKDGLDLMVVYPNPSTETLYLDVTMDEPGLVSGQIYSIHGELIKSINQKTLSNGKHTLTVDVRNFASGNYVIVLEAGDKSAVSKFVVMD